MRLPKLSDCVVFFDFDNTMVTCDLLDGIIERFAIDENWKIWERRWRRGRIGSRKCLENQLKSVRVSREELANYLRKNVRLVPYVREVFDLLKKEGIRPVILSDNFSWIISHLLKQNGVDDAKIFSNTLRFRSGRLLPSFPRAGRRCGRCANCKRSYLRDKRLKDKIVIYVGDGLSDVHAAQEADIVFAKDDLLRHFRKTERLCMAYKNFKDIYNYLRGLDG